MITAQQPAPTPVEKGYPHGRCTAKSKQSGQRCKNRPSPGMTVCRIHGGATPRGIAAPTFKHGKYSKHLPSRLIERYNDAVDDPALLEMRHEIALLDARLTDILGRVDTGESGTAWRGIQSAYNDLRKALSSGNSEMVSNALFDLNAHIEKGHSDYAAWHEIHSLMEQRRKLVESEQKRLQTMDQMITAEQAIAYATAVLSSVKAHVTDRKVLNEISIDIQRLVTAPVRTEIAVRAEK